MKPDEIQKLLSLGEGQRVEFKAGTRNPALLGRIICGFLNTTGGYLVCGIDERGKVLGVDPAAAAIATLEKQLHDGLSPKALVAVQIQPLAGKPVLVIEVPAGKDVPYAFRDAIYLRTGDTTQPADGATIRDIVMRRQIEPERWERRFSFADLATDVDTAEILAAVGESQKVRRAFFRDAAQPLMVLEDFAAAKYGRLTNGGDVLFAKNPATRLPQIRIRAMRYNSDKAGDTYRDLKSFEGPLHALFEDAYSFIVRNTPSVSRFLKGNPKRQDAPLFPENAVREALINALAHRDYSASSGGVSIHIFPQRLEIWNSGSLPDGVTATTLALGHISVLRNPDIAHALYLRGLMEKAGRGSVLMIQQCRDNGLPDPEWKSDDKLGVSVCFKIPHVALHVTPVSWPPKSAPEVDPASRPRKSAPHVTPHVTPHVERLLKALNGEMSRSDLMAIMEIKDRIHFGNTYLRPALETGVVEMTRPDKPKSVLQRYRLTVLGKAVRAKHRP